PGGSIMPYNDSSVRAAAEGTGLSSSAGDDGAETVNGYQSADWPASSPWVTAVGGTSLEVGASNDYLREFGWSTTRSILTGGQWSPALPGSLLYGSGGG